MEADADEAELWLKNGLLPGTVVEVVGLTGNVALNGRRGVVKPRAPNAKLGRVGGWREDIKSYHDQV